MARSRPIGRSSRSRTFVRSVPLRGEGEDSGRYFKCWYCGNVCDIRTNALNDGKRGVNVTLATLPAGVYVGDEMSVRIRIGQAIILRAIDTDGTAKPVYRERSVAASSGCPGCGRHNWKK